MGVGAGPARESRAGRAPTWGRCGWGSVGADPIRESRRYVRLSRTRSAPTGEEYRASRQPVGAGPARESRAGRAPTWGRCGWGSVGADLIREPRRYVRLSRTRSAPTGGGIPCFPTTCRSGPCPRIARRARSYMGTMWVGRRSGSHPRIAPICPAIEDKVRSYRGRLTIVGWVERSDTHHRDRMGFASSTHPTKSLSARGARSFPIQPGQLPLAVFQPPLQLHVIQPCAVGDQPLGAGQADLGLGVAAARDRRVDPAVLRRG